MKIAICFYGNVPKIEPFRKGKENSPYIDLSIPARHYKHFIIDANPDCQFDTFIHSSSSEFYDKLQELYNPIIASYTVNPFKLDQSTPDKVREYGNKSRWFSTGIVNSLKNVHAVKKQFLYDFVFLTRLDVVFFEPIIFSKLDPNKFYIQGTNYENVGPEWEKAGRTLDWWFIANHNNMNSFARAYGYFDSLVNETEKLGLPHYDQHCIAYQMIKNNNLPTEKLLHREDDNVLVRFIQRQFHERTKKNEWKLNKETGLYERL